jgi:hypothetical protein
LLLPVAKKARSLSLLSHAQEWLAGMKKKQKNNRLVRQGD